MMARSEMVSLRRTIMPGSRRGSTAIRAAGVVVACALAVPAVVSAMQRSAAQPTASPQGRGTASVVAAANAFLATLDDAGRATVSFSFASSQKTSGWSNLPSGIFERHGLRLGDLSAPQRQAALALVAT